MKEIEKVTILEKVESQITKIEVSYFNEKPFIVDDSELANTFMQAWVCKCLYGAGTVSLIDTLEKEECLPYQQSTLQAFPEVQHA